MRKKTSIIKVFVGLTASLFVLAPLLPAKAFYLVYDQTCNIQGVELPGSCSSYDTGSAENNTSPPAAESAANPAPGGEGQPVVQPKKEPFNPDGPMTGPGQGGEFGNQPMGSGGQMSGPSDEQMEERRKQDEERQLKDMKRGVRQMENNLKRFESMVKKAEKSGPAIPQEIKEKLEKAKGIIEAIKSAATMEEMQSAGMDEFQEIMQDLEQAREDLFEKAQRLQSLKRNVKGMEQGLKMFERQLSSLAKQKITVPADVSEKIQKLKTIIETIKNAKTWDEVEAVGLEEMQDLMQGLDESRQQLEVLARWPQTLKQVERELKNLERELKRSKTIVVRLVKKGFDLNGVYAEFEAAVSKLRAVKEEAAAKMNSGDSQDAFDLLQNDFFGQMDDIWQNQRIIMTMSNLGRFASDFKQGIAMSQRQIKMLEKKGMDVAELKDLLEQAKVRGNEILQMMKEKPVDPEAILSALQEMEGMKEEFESKMADLTGGEEMPWEKGPPQFKPMEMPSGFNNLMPQKAKPMEGGPGGGPGVNPAPVEPSPSVAPGGPGI